MYSKKLCVMLLICLCVSFPAYGEKIQVVTEELSPYNYTADGKIVGFCTEVVREILERVNLEYSITSYAWEEAYKIAQAEPNVLIYSIGRNVERESLFKWAGMIIKLEVYFFKLKSRADIRIETLDDARKYKTGVVRDDFRAQLLEKQGFDYQLIYAPDDRENMLNLFNRKVDIVPLDVLSAFHIAGQEGHSFINEVGKTLHVKDMSAELYIAFSKQTSDEIVVKCREALSAMREDGTYEEIKSKYDVFYLPLFQLRSF